MDEARSGNGAGTPSGVGGIRGPGGPAAEPLEVRPSAPAFVADPYPVYARLRREAPAHFVEAEGVWWITRYADVARALGDERFGKEWARDAPDGVGGDGPADAGPAAAAPPETGEGAPRESGAPAADPPPDPYARLWELPPNMLDRDPPAHTRLRALVSRAFTPRVVERLRPHIEAIAEDLLGAAERRGAADLVADFAFPLPATVIAELLGVPAADRARFGAWSAAIIHGLDGSAGQEVREASNAANLALMDYLTDLAAERRASPRADMITDLLAAEAEGDRLSFGEVISMCILLLIAGHETTSSLIGSGTLTLLRQPDAAQTLRAHPERLPAAVEELLRYESPVQRFFRVVRADVEVGGRHIPAGASAMLVFAAANRDPEVFADPDRLDFERRPNPHLAFGRGIHFCLGAPLARLEAQVAFAALLRRWPRLRADVSRPRWNPHSVIRSLRALPVRFGP